MSTTTVSDHELFLVNEALDALLAEHDPKKVDDVGPLSEGLRWTRTSA
jgi:hypothetical protein